MALNTLSKAAAHEQDGTNPATPSGDLRAEYQALVEGCGLYDLSGRARIAVTGGDRVRWLNGMVSNNVRDLAPGHGVYAFLLNAQGHIQADLFVFQRGDSLLVDTEGTQREKVLQLFDRYIIADDVEVADVSASVAAIGLAGPRASEMLRRAGILAPELGPLEFCSPKCECDCGCLQCTVVRSDDAAGVSYEIWLTPEKRKATSDALAAAGAIAVGPDSLELLRIRHGVPRFGVDIRERDLPQETGQLRALSFTKGCYLGQEIVERIRSRGAVHRSFTAFTVEGDLPAAGAKIFAADQNDKELGEITSSTVLPHAGGDRRVCLGYLRREAAGKNLRAGTAALRVASLPIA
jgi:aminomethyltransferase